MPPLVAKIFVPLRTQPPSTFSAFVRSEETSEPAFGSVTQKAATFGSCGGAEHLRRPREELVRRAGGRERRQREAGAEDREADAGAAPADLFHDQRQAETGRVAQHRVRVEVEPVQPDLRRLLHDGPRELLGLVVLRGDRTDLVLGEVVCPLLELFLLLAQAKSMRSAPFFSCV